MYIQIYTNYVLPNGMKIDPSPDEKLQSSSCFCFQKKLFIISTPRMVPPVCHPPQICERKWPWCLPNHSSSLVVLQFPQPENQFSKHELKCWRAFFFKWIHSFSDFFFPQRKVSFHFYFCRFCEDCFKCVHIERTSCLWSLSLC